jgi:hypothetical protein
MMPMNIAVAVVLIVVGIIFAANVLGSLSGRYGSARRWRNVLLAGGVSTIAFVGALLLLSN